MKSHDFVFLVNTSHFCVFVECRARESALLFILEKAKFEECLTLAQSSRVVWTTPAPSSSIFTFHPHKLQAGRNLAFEIL